MTVGKWTIHWDALLARIVFRWHRRIAISTAAAAAVIAVASGLIPPVWRGRAHLVVHAPPAAVVRLDGRPVAPTLYAGRHTVSATLPDGRTSWAEVQLTSGVTTTLELPPGLAPIEVRPLPPAAPGTAITRVSHVAGAWRIQSSAVAVAADDGSSETVLQDAQTVALTADGLEPLATIDAFGGRADVLRTADSSLEAVTRRMHDTQTPLVSVSGWTDLDVTVPITGSVSLLRFAPSGRLLAVSEQISPLGERVSVIAPDGTPSPLVSVPGRVRDLVWDPASQGLVVASEHGGQASLTLARVGTARAARVIAEHAAQLDAAVPRDAAASTPAAPRAPFVVAPLLWTGDALEWIAADEQGRSWLWRAPLATLIPQRVAQLDAVAFTRLPTGALRIATVRDGMLLLGQFADGQLVVEGSVPDLPAAATLRGQWAPDGRSLLVQDVSRAWIIDLPPPQPDPAGGAGVPRRALACWAAAAPSWTRRGRCREGRKSHDG